MDSHPFNHFTWAGAACIIAIIIALTAGYLIGPGGCDVKSGYTRGWLDGFDSAGEIFGAP